MEKASIRMDDGDSFFYRGLAIRILGIDAPEIIHEEHGIFEDQPCGRKAAAMTAALLREAKTIEYLPYQNDKYGRLLRYVYDGDVFVNREMIEKGYALARYISPGEKYSKDFL